MADKAAVSHTRTSFARENVVKVGHVAVEDSTVGRDAHGAEDAAEKMSQPSAAKLLCIRVVDQPKPLCYGTDPIVRIEAQDVTKQHLARQSQGKDCK